MSDYVGGAHCPLELITFLDSRSFSVGHPVLQSRRVEEMGNLRGRNERDQSCHGQRG